MCCHVGCHIHGGHATSVAVPLTAAGAAPVPQTVTVSPTAAQPFNLPLPPLNVAAGGAGETLFVRWPIG